MTNPTTVVTARTGPFKHKQFLVHHAGGVVRTLTFRVGKQVGYYAGEFRLGFSGTPVVNWVPVS